jgi:rubredoxin
VNGPVGGVLVDVAGTVVGRVPATAFTAAVPWTDVVWRGRVFRHTGRAEHGGERVHRFSEQHALVLETPYVCPACGVERTDFEGLPGGHLILCPDCGAERTPVPLGLEDEQARVTTVPRELLAAVRGELRSATGHWAAGFTALGEQITKHDRRMDDGSCATCALLGLLDSYLYQAAEPAVSDAT